MKRHLIQTVSIALFALSTSAFAAEFGTADEAKAMLNKAVMAVKADKAAALGQFAKGEAGFKDRDLYPFCGGTDGNFSAHPSLNGKSLKDLKDKAGKSWGGEIYKTAQERSVKEIA